MLINASIFKRCRMDMKAKKLHSAWTETGKVCAKLTNEGKPFYLPDQPGLGAHKL